MEEKETQAQENKDHFYPKGSIFFFILLLIFFAIIWFGFYYIMVVRS